MKACITFKIYIMELEVRKPNGYETSDTSNSNLLHELTLEIRKRLSRVTDLAVSFDNSLNETLELDTDMECYFTDFCALNDLNRIELLTLAAVLVSYTHPTFYFSLFNAISKKPNNVFGGYNDLDTGVVYPTIQTLEFILYNSSNGGRRSVLLKSKLFKRGIIISKPLPNVFIPNNPVNYVVSISDEHLSYFFSGTYSEPEFSQTFPAKKINAKLNWSDLVVDSTTMQQIEELISWQQYQTKVLGDWELDRIIKPGYRALFHGPPGTGKTLTASLIGNELRMDVYQIDLSMVVSKYIGETEKNLSALFDRAKNKNWILFFDEADALFGKRSDVKDSHDRYANQQVSYLLQRVEDYSGIVILATNLKGNIDKAFSRRFQNIIKFNMPDSVQREKLWRNSFSSRTVFEHELVIPDLAKSYELSGGSIINVVQYASLKAAERGNNVILYNDVKTAILREMHKDGRTPS
jgi:hypothetical protein